MIREAAKTLLPESLIRTYREIYWRFRNESELRKLSPLARELRLRSALAKQTRIELSSSAELARKVVEAAAIRIYGENYNYYSDALRMEIVQGFEKTLNSMIASNRTTDYLEIGSCRGLSMGLIGTMLLNTDRLGSLVSIDPYFESGFVEGRDGPYGENNLVKVDKTTKEQAQRLYEDIGLRVELIEETSLVGLRRIVESGRRFDLIYIDGAHERLWPAVDFGLSCAALRPDGIIVLDDHLWPDVNPLKLLCDRHMERIQETWKTASYRIKI
jgi:predicted O-methyltransferase YrrM